MGLAGRIARLGTARKEISSANDLPKERDGRAVLKHFRTHDFSSASTQCQAESSARKQLLPRSLMEFSTNNPVRTNTFEKEYSCTVATREKRPVPGRWHVVRSIVTSQDILKKSSVSI